MPSFHSLNKYRDNLGVGNEVWKAEQKPRAKQGSLLKLEPHAQFQAQNSIVMEIYFSFANQNTSIWKTNMAFRVGIVYFIYLPVY